MSFFSKFFGSKKMQTSEQPIQEQMVNQSEWSIYKELIPLITNSETLQNELSQNVQQALNDPKSFYDEDGTYILADRGLSFPNNVTAKFVFIDTLQDNGVMAEIDWKEDEEEVRIAINNILNCKNYDLLISNELSNNDIDTFEFLEWIESNELKPNGYALECLDIDSDSYIFTIIPTDVQPKVAALFEQL